MEQIKDKTSTKASVVPGRFLLVYLVQDRKTKVEPFIEGAVTDRPTDTSDSRGLYKQSPSSLVIS